MSHCGLEKLLAGIPEVVLVTVPARAEQEAGATSVDGSRFVTAGVAASLDALLDERMS